MATIRVNPANRKYLDNSTDPYTSRKSPSCPVLCPKCHAIQRHKRWHLDVREAEELLRKKDGVQVRRCPACRKIADGFPGGLVHLEGEYLRRHREEIVNLIRNEERRAMGVNPMARIMSLEEREDEVDIATTDEKLAQRIGREVCKACSGKVEYKWSEDTKLLRVNWAR